MLLALKSSRFLNVVRLAAMAVTFALPALAADPAPEDAQSRFEVDYLTDLIDHHHAAVEMAKLVEERTERPELRKLADSLVTAQEKEITILQGWLEDWYGETYEPELERRAERQIAALEELEGDEFEQAFLRAMSLHHADALSMAGGGLLSAFHSDLIDFIREMVAVQADEIALMRGWLLEWHDINEVTSRDRPDNRKWSKAGPRIPVAVTPRGP